jgi:hypothetical protein
MPWRTSTWIVPATALPSFASLVSKGSFSSCASCTNSASYIPSILRAASSAARPRRSAVVAWTVTPMSSMTRTAAVNSPRLRRPARNAFLRRTPATSTRAKSTVSAAADPSRMPCCAEPGHFRVDASDSAQALLDVLERGGRSLTPLSSRVPADQLQNRSEPLLWQLIHQVVDLLPHRAHKNECTTPPSRRHSRGVLTSVGLRESACAHLETLLLKSRP